jgi:hypothetical protein
MLEVEGNGASRSFLTTDPKGATSSLPGGHRITSEHVKESSFDEDRHGVVFDVSMHSCLTRK